MRPGIDKNIFVCTVFDKDRQYLMYISSFVGTGVQLAIRICAGSPFPKTIIRFGVYDTFLVDACQIPSTLPHFLSSFEDNRFESQLQATVSCKKPGRSGTDDDDRWGIPNGFQFGNKRGKTWRFVDKEDNLDAVDYLTSTGIDRALVHTESMDTFDGNPKFLCTLLFDIALIMNEVGGDG